MAVNEIAPSRDWVAQGDYRGRDSLIIARRPHWAGSNPAVPTSNGADELVASRTGQIMRIRRVEISGYHADATATTETYRLQATDGTTTYDIIPPQRRVASTNERADYSAVYDTDLIIPEDFNLQILNDVLTVGSFSVAVWGWWEDAHPHNSGNILYASELPDSTDRTSLITGVAGRNILIEKFGFVGYSSGAGGLLTIEQGDGSTFTNMALIHDDQPTIDPHDEPRDFILQVKWPCTAGYNVYYTTTTPFVNRSSVWMQYRFVDEERRPDDLDFTGDTSGDQ